MSLDLGFTFPGGTHGRCVSLGSGCRVSLGWPRLGWNSTGDSISVEARDQALGSERT